MKSFNTLTAAIFCALLLFCGGTFAKGKTVQENTLVERAFKVFPPSLESSYPGIVESTIYNVITLKKYYPSADYSVFINKLNEISEKSSDPALRYKAHLASVYLSFSDVIKVEPKAHSFDREYLFRQIADQLENKLALGN